MRGTGDARPLAGGRRGSELQQGWLQPGVARAISLGCSLHKKAEDVSEATWVMFVKGIQGKGWGCCLFCNTGPGLTLSGNCN